MDDLQDYRNRIEFQITNRALGRAVDAEDLCECGLELLKRLQSNEEELDWWANNGVPTKLHDEKVDDMREEIERGERLVRELEAEVLKVVEEKEALEREVQLLRGQLATATAPIRQTYTTKPAPKRTRVKAGG